MHVTESYSSPSKKQVQIDQIHPPQCPIITFCVVYLSENIEYS